MGERKVPESGEGLGGAPSQVQIFLNTNEMKVSRGVENINRSVINIFC